MRDPAIVAPSRDSQAGFSLLEILVGLALLSAIASLVTVSSISMVQSMRERTELRQLTNSIEMYRYIALTKDKQLIIHSDPTQNYFDEKSPEDWRMQATPPIVFSRHGTCTTGSLYLTSPRGRTYSYLLVPQDCRLQSVE